MFGLRGVRVAVGRVLDIPDFLLERKGLLIEADRLCPIPKVRWGILEERSCSFGSVLAKPVLNLQSRKAFIIADVAVYFFDVAAFGFDLGAELVEGLAKVWSDGRGN